MYFWKPLYFWKKEGTNDQNKNPFVTSSHNFQLSFAYYMLICTWHVPRFSSPSSLSKVCREGWEKWKGRPMLTHWCQVPHKHSTFPEWLPSLPRPVLAPQRSTCGTSTRAHESSWSCRRSPHPSHTSHHLPLAQLPQLHSAIHPWASTYFHLTCFLSQTHLGWLLSLSALPANWVPHPSTSCPTWSMQFPQTPTCSQPHWWY